MHQDIEKLGRCNCINKYIVAGIRHGLYENVKCCSYFRIDEGYNKVMEFGGYR